MDDLAGNPKQIAATKCANISLGDNEDVEAVAAEDMVLVLVAGGLVLAVGGMGGGEAPTRRSSRRNGSVVTAVILSCHDGVTASVATT